MTLCKTMSAVLSAVMLMSTMTGFTSAEKIRTPDTSSSPDTYTYYFLAPDNYFETGAGAVNSSVGAYWWGPDEPAAWPGVEMTPAFDVGENIFKIEGVTKETTNIIFNSFVDAGSPADPSLAECAYQTIDINTEGYDSEYECPYDTSVITDNFNGWIYVLNNDWTSDLSEFSGIRPVGGAWFTLDDYKNHDDYYGTYDFDQEYSPDINTDPYEDDDNPREYHYGDIVEFAVRFGNIEGGSICSYEYNIPYNDFYVEPLLTNDGKLVYESFATNSEQAPELSVDDELLNIHISMNSPKGIEQETSEESVELFKIKFKVNSTIILGNWDGPINGYCESLKMVSDDSGLTIPLLHTSGFDNDGDVYSDWGIIFSDNLLPKEGSDKGEIKFNAGDIVDVTVRMGNIMDGTVAAYDYDCYYDPEFAEPVLDEFGELVMESYATNDNDPPMVIANPTNPGLIKLGFVSGWGIKQDTSGKPVDLLKIQFKVKKDASKLGIMGKCTTLAIVTNDGEAVTILGPRNAAEDIYTSLNIGDLDNDGAITSSDALNILRLSVGLDNSTPEKQTLADIDEDGAVSSSDALDVIRYSVALPSNFKRTIISGKLSQFDYLA